MTCLDTSFLIALERSDPGTRELLAEATARSPAMVPMTAWMEYLAGVQPALWPMAQEILARSATLVPFGEAEARQAAQLQQWCQGVGRRRQWTDLQVAATALQAGVPLLTLDADFKDLPGLEVHTP